MWDALRTSLGKLAGQRLIFVGTRAPAAPDSWWPALLDAGSGPGTHIEVRTAPDDAPWDAWPTIRAVNPMVMLNPALRRTILRERDEARRNETLRPAFEAYRLNRQVDVRSEVLIGVAAWRRVEVRAVPEREGRPVVGFDMGGERSWSAAWCLWENGRVEAFALCPGVPSLAERERQLAFGDRYIGGNRCCSCCGLVLVRLCRGGGCSQRLRARFQSFRRGRSQMSFLGLSYSLSRS